MWRKLQKSQGIPASNGVGAKPSTNEVDLRGIIWALSFEEPRFLVLSQRVIDDLAHGGGVKVFLVEEGDGPGIQT